MTEFATAFMQGLLILTASVLLAVTLRDALKGDNDE